MTTPIQVIISETSTPAVRNIGEKFIHGERISQEDGLVLFKEASLPLLGALANWKREQLHGHNTYFNRNFHIEPTNVCVFSCKFCSYSRLYAHREEGWELTTDAMLEIVRKYDGIPVTEVHIVGGVHPKLSLEFFADLLRKIKAHRPTLHIKAFTAVELDYMFRKAKKTNEEGLLYLQQAGLDSLPGGGAEIFAPAIREQICEDKVDAAGWLAIHQTAHKLGMPSNATMLYGHIESWEHRIDHMEQLRQLQDRTHGFNAFIPLKFRNRDNEMSHVKEVSLIEDLRMYSLARIYMDNFQNIKAYWPMLGRQNAQMTLSFGVNDIDGTIDDTTKIYSMAGSEEQNPKMTTQEIVQLIRNAGRRPLERDTLYNTLRTYDEDKIEAENASI
jgi:aminodeoxyfutalosine synthase